MKQDFQESNYHGSKDLVSKGEIAIITSCEDDWGGSEELWARAIPYLQSDGYSISIYKMGINKNHPEYVKFAASGIRLVDLAPPPVIKKTVAFRAWRRAWKYVQPSAYPLAPGRADEVLREKFVSQQPTLVIVAQGINFDGVVYGQVCMEMQLNYVVISQKAAEFIWPEPFVRRTISTVFQHSLLNIFVSKHNLRVTEEQIGRKLQNSTVLFNPVKLSRKIIPYPSVVNGYKLACIGRYFLMDKGQYILLRIMAFEKWQKRPLTITFMGNGKDKEALEEMAAYLKLKSVEFRGFVNDIERIWEEFHALILPSRGEGMPLVMLEAMSAGRTVIASNAGGNTEIVEDGITGFIGLPLDEPFDRLMETAWENRSNWEEMGRRASIFINEHVPGSPEKVFAAHLKTLIHG